MSIHFICSNTYAYEIESAILSQKGCTLSPAMSPAMFPVFLPRVTGHYNEFTVSRAINTGLGGNFVSHVHVSLTIYQGRPYQQMKVYFYEKEGNEKTAEFFRQVEQGEVIFYTGAVNRWGKPFYWKIKKACSCVNHVPCQTRYTRPPGLKT